MKKEEIHFGDWNRLFIGEAPWEFLLETAIRCTVVYLFFFVAIRLLGKRMSAQMTIFELAVIITLGAAISLPMESPDKGIIPGILILFAVVAFQKGLSFLTFKSYRAEAVTQGELSILLKDGRLLLDQMEKCVLSRERLFAELRTRQIKHLGEIDRVYFEGCGLFSVIKNSRENPGLSILPEWDRSLRESNIKTDGLFACYSCGNVHQDMNKCKYCNSERWVPAITNQKR